MTVVLTIAKLILRLWQLLLLLQFIFMFLPIEWENRTMSVLRAITEPFLAPIRALLEKTGLFLCYACECSDLEYSRT